MMKFDTSEDRYCHDMANKETLHLSHKQGQERKAKQGEHGEVNLYKKMGGHVTGLASQRRIVRPYGCPSVHPSVRLSIRPSLHRFARSHICLCARLCVRPSFSLSDSQSCRLALTFLSPDVQASSTHTNMADHNQMNNSVRTCH